MSTTNRGLQWERFADQVLNHVETYTVGQYGDHPNDQATDFTVSEMQMNLKRYVNRIGTGQRGEEEQVRDCLKIAHYACLLMAEIKQEDCPNAGS